MFCLDKFYVKCIIKKNYLPPYGPLKVTVQSPIPERGISATLVVGVTFGG